MMKYKGYLVDIDNTLYPYEINHKRALNTVLQHFTSDLNIDHTILSDAYNTARKKIHLEHNEYASSHNRLLYFQRMFELIGVSSTKYAFNAYTMYWDEFINYMTPFENVYNFLELIKEEKLCLVTDLTSDIQFRKIEKLELQNYFEYVVTSEEAGREKPHPYMFLMALNKLQLTPSEVCMIGDSYNKDIIGASNLGITSYWLNPSNSEGEKNDNNTIVSFTNFEELMRLIRR